MAGAYGPENEGDAPNGRYDDLVMVVAVEPGPRFTVTAVGGEPVARGSIPPARSTGVALAEVVPEVDETSVSQLEAAWRTRRPQRYDVDRRDGRYHVLVTPIIEVDGSCTTLITHAVEARSRPERRRHQVNAAIVDAIPGSVALLDQDGVIRAVNAGWVRFGLERSHDGVLADAGTSYLDISDAAAATNPAASRASAAIRAVLRGELELATTEYLAGPSGDEWFTMRVAPVHVDDECWAVVMHEDITDLREARGRWQAMFRSAAVPTLLLSTDSRILEANQATANLLGVEVRQLVGASALEFIEAEFHQVVIDRQHDALVGVARETPLELRLVRPDGGRLTVIAHPPITELGRMGGTVIQLVDLTSQRRAEARLALHRELLELVAAGTPLPEVALAVAANIGRALDGATGGVLLRGVPPIPSPDLPEQWLPLIGTFAPDVGGADPSISHSDAPVLAWSTSVAAPEGVPTAAVVVLALHPGQHDADATALLTAVLRLALQRDAAAGALMTDAFGRAQGALAASMPGADEAADDLRRGLKAGELGVHYQPIIDLETGAVVSLEGLVRWQHPTRGLVPPIELIQVAERSGLIDEVGALVLSIACHDLARWRTHGAPALTMAVNLSARQLAAPDVVDVVRNALDAAGLEPSALVVEITESVIVDDLEAVVDALGALRAIGVRVAIDDFGTGYSSLLYLKRFPADVLKVDQLFVQGLGVHDGDTAIVDAVIGLGHRLGMTVTAEGVETDDQLLELRRRRCDHAQGFFLHRPVPAADVGRILDTGAVELGPEPEAVPASSSDLDELLAIVTHEISTPLTVIGGHAELLVDHLRRGQRNPSPAVDAIERNIRNLDELLRSLTSVTNALRAPTGVTTIDVGRLVEQTVDDLAPLLAQHDVVVEVEATVAADAEAVGVRQVLTNLLSNAVKFTQPGTHIDVTVRAPGPDQAEVIVADQGPGIPVDREGELFRRFSRLGASARGLGLGLQLSRTLARRQGGDLVHQRTPGGGATFILRIPA